MSGGGGVDCGLDSLKVSGEAQVMSLGVVPGTAMAGQGAGVRKATELLVTHARLSSSEPSCGGPAFVQRKRPGQDKHLCLKPHPGCPHESRG